MYKVIFYRDKKGNEPIRELLEELEKKAFTSKHDRIQYKKILLFISVLEKLGTRAGEEITKHIEGDIWELRPLDNRIFFFGWKDNSFVLLHHFKKKTNKTPIREIEKAKKEYQEWKNRNN